MRSFWNLDVLANVVDADLALTLGDLNGQAAAVAQKVCITMLKEVQLSIADLLALGLFKHGKPPQRSELFELPVESLLGWLIQPMASSQTSSKSVGH